MVQFSSNPVEGTAAESELVIYRSELASYNPSSNKFIRINIPVADKGWIDWGDSVLSLKLTNRSYDTGGASTTDTQVKTQMNNLIKSVSVLNSQGQQIEYVNNYNLINNIMDDYSMSANHKQGVEQVLNGGSPNGDPDGGTALGGANSITEADGSSITFCDRLMTGFTSGQYLLPLGYCVGQSTAIVIELEDPTTAFQIASPGTNVNLAYKVENVQLRARQIKFNSLFNESFEKTLAEAGSVGINYITESFLHNQNVVNASTAGKTNIPFSCNPRSAKYILACARQQDKVQGDDARLEYSLGTRSGLNIIDYTFEIAGKQYPSQPIEVSSTNSSQGFAQVLDCLGQIGSLNHNTLVTIATARTLFYDATAANPCKFIAGLPLEDFNSSTNPSVYSGMNLQTVGSMSFQPNVSTLDPKAYRIDIFTSIDMSIHFTIDGRMYSVR